MIIGISKIDKCDEKIKSLISLISGQFHNVVVTSGYRSPEENKALPNASKTSQHCLGLAVDVILPDNSCIVLAAFVLGLDSIKIKGLGLDVYKNYCHFDFRQSDNLVKWSYGKDGKQA